MKMYEITRQSPLTKGINTMMMPVAPVQIAAWLEMENKPHVQDMFPQLTPAQREFLLTGFTKADWDSIFGEEE